jgi:N-acetylglucosaminyldiphosphoundecaprenol N-acetyl-beta-D-mannosaminyltransferase
MPGMQDPERLDVLGIKVGCLDLEQAVAIIEEGIATRRQTYVCVTGAHGIMESQRDRRLRDIHNAGLVVPDGMPVVWFVRLCGRHAARIYGPDLMRELTKRSAERGYAQFYYGGSHSVLHRLREKLLSAHPDLRIAGSLSPPFRDLTPQEDDANVALINAVKPDIVWVGLSTPKQERWMAAHLGRLDAPIMIGVGAAFDFLSGTKNQAPIWMQRNGLEWLFRLISEPRRLWRRYAYIVPGFAWLAVVSLVRRKFESLRRAPSHVSASR